MMVNNMNIIELAKKAKEASYKLAGISLEIISVFFKLGLVSPVKLDSSISKSTAY